MKRTITKISFIAIMLCVVMLAANCKKDETTTPPNNNNSAAPVLTTTAITDITETTAKSGGNITSDGGATVTARGVCWSIGQTPTISDNKTIDGTGAGIFASNINNLLAGTTYYVRAYATNAKGTSYGNEISFQTPPSLTPLQKQWGLVIEYTATFSAICGQSGAYTMNTLCNTPYVVGIACHAASVDPMYNAVLYNSLNSDRTNNTSVPIFWIGDIKSNSTSEMSALLAKTPTAAIDLNYTKTATTMIVNTRTKFYTTGSGNYFLSVYLLESGIDGSTSAPSAYQQIGATNPSDYVHNWVLRNTSISSNAYGESIINGNITNGQIFDKTYTISIDPSWTKTLYPVAVLWKYNASSTVPKYKFINCFQIK